MVGPEADGRLDEMTRWTRLATSGTENERVMAVFMGFSVVLGFRFGCWERNCGICVLKKRDEINDDHDGGGDLGEDDDLEFGEREEDLDFEEDFGVDDLKTKLMSKICSLFLYIFPGYIFSS
ncbi:hypothetical protein QYF36_003754 [Acer negundo]|nr:hypothetical protein QYF36_003754 [Acer negundo]